MNFLIVSFFFSPFLFSDSFTILQNDGFFWTFFATLSLSIALIMILFFDVASVITCAIFLSFAIILPLDYWIGSTLKYIIINFTRRVAVEGFNLAIIQHPTQTKGIYLLYIYTLSVTIFYFTRIYLIEISSESPVDTPH